MLEKFKSEIVQQFESKLQEQSEKNYDLEKELEYKNKTIGIKIYGHKQYSRRYSLRIPNVP